MLVPLTQACALLALSSVALSAPVQQIPFSDTSIAQPELSLASLNIEPSIRSRLDQHIASLPEKRLVRLADDAQPIEVTEGEKSILVMKGIRFVDVTEEDPALVAAAQVAIAGQDAFPTKLSYSVKQAQPLFDTISLERMKTFLTRFSGFHTRYYRSSTGKQSQEFLLNHVKEIIKSNPKIADSISVKEFPHSWGQNSIILRFEPSSKASALRKKQGKEQVVILGAHQDSTNMFPFLAAPGADDDGSGTTTLVEALTVLVNASFIPSDHPVEFHWYSAEEGGLLGSQAVAQSYARDGKKVRSMLQMDMTAFVKPGTTPTYGIIRDFVSPEFTDLVALLIDEYGDISRTDTQCGYACSDHASWSKVGAPSAFAIESSFPDSNKKIHSSGDTIQNEGFSFEHMRSFVRLSVGMTLEMGGAETLFS
ncbi:BZ3500_MvSof-1268-A1-R1_Chr2-1g04348 [Microbotryum saponariae]|uniref:Peptide hydrolase n=1 Tax=Microbotryum saponariae TaxID=289078 RepID=A0A2X0KKC4_9BASI|nr:BZ3500_MvSof-1268-A1-R1_Chr2-1g04348 [Microbotryum saponariae]SCZ91506.1 BZ3501_MvSof-1269-A2-R1_Chr2-1g04004 [Microbotryum saponariae]